MKPDPGRANGLRDHFQKGPRGIAKRLWPHLHLVLAVDSGSNQIYGEMLRDSYCQGVPFYSPFYAATEGRARLTLDPQLETAQWSVPATQAPPPPPVQVSSGSTCGPWSPAGATCSAPAPCSASSCPRAAWRTRAPRCC